MTDAQPPEDDLELDEEEELEKEPRASGTAAVPRNRREAETRQRAVSGSEEELPYIDDRASKIWVAAIAAVFGLILVYGLLFGHAGALNPATPSPTPSPVPSATVTATPVPSSSAGTTPAPSTTITPAASVTASPAPASPTAAPSLTAAPSST